MIMMNFKSTLWALAFACVAVSCSDDVDDGLNNNKGNELNGPTAYMKVKINSGVATKATTKGAELGDEPGGEIGIEDEYMINNVVIVLYTDGNLNGTTGVYEFTSQSEIIAAGSATVPAGSMGDGDNLSDWHSKGATVSLSVKPGKQEYDGQTYGVLTVVNYDEPDALVTEVLGEGYLASTLANKLLEMGELGKFVMTSHINDPQLGGINKDVVTLKAGATADNAPEANVHVERLAAKIRINEAGIEGKPYFYDIKQPNTTTSIATVRLEQAVVLNKLLCGSYLLKRVSENVQAEATAIPESKDNDVWLGDEQNTASGDANTNYVIDPWTRNKNLNNGSITGEIHTNATLEYTNPLISKVGDVQKSYKTLFSEYSSTAVTLADANETSQITLAYTGENTLDYEDQKNGLSTGVLFKATYFPKKWSTQTNVDGKDVITEVVTDFGKEDNPTEITNATEGVDFYVYQGNIYKEVDDIFNEYVWNEQKNVGESGKVYSFSDFSSTSITSIKASDFKNSLLYGKTDPFGYLKWLSICADQLGDNTFNDAHTFSNYVATNDDYKNTYAANVRFFEKGETYYTYWIRHIDNHNINKMGIMEFGIVRNNIYDMTVTGISGLGFAGAEKPDPGKDNETEEYFFNVTINVKNWVVRSNSGIIL